MNLVYPSALDGFMKGQLNLASPTQIAATLLKSGYTYSDTHVFYSSVTSGARIQSIILPTTAVSNGVLTAGSGVWHTPTAGQTIIAMVVYVYNASDAAARLLAYIDTNADFSPLNAVTDGFDVQYDWPITGVMFI